MTLNPGNERGAAPHFVGLCAAHRDEVDELGAVSQAEVLEVGHHIARRRPRPGLTDHPPHRVVVRGERMSCPAEKKKVHRRQQQVGPSLAYGSFAEEGQHLGIVGDATADGVIGRGSVAFGALGKDSELFRDGKVGQRSRGWREEAVRWR